MELSGNLRDTAPNLHFNPHRPYHEVNNRARGYGHPPPVWQASQLQNFLNAVLELFLGAEVEAVSPQQLAERVRCKNLSSVHRPFTPARTAIPPGGRTATLGAGNVAVKTADRKAASQAAVASESVPGEPTARCSAP